MVAKHLPLANRCKSVASGGTYLVFDMGRLRSTLIRHYAHIRSSVLVAQRTFYYALLQVPSLGSDIARSASSRTTPERFQALYPGLIGWIRGTLAAHAAHARPVASAGFERLPHYFSENLLASAKFVAVDQVPTPPLQELGLSRFAAFLLNDPDGITYLDTYFVRRVRATDEALHFHELIHVVQWLLLGPEYFLGAYAAGLEGFGYRDSPLERMAYDAQSAFATGQVFDAEKLVAQKLSRQ